MLRLITEGAINPEEAVHAYHGVLQAKGIKAHRSLDRDLQLTEQAMSYDETNKSKSTVVVPSGVPQSEGSTKTKENSGSTQASSLATVGSLPNVEWPVKPDGKPDFAAMDSQQRRAYDRARLKRMFG